MEKPSIPFDDAGDFLPDNSPGETDETPCSLEQDILPPIDLKDKKTWWFFRNGDGEEMMDTVSVAERWARTMQKQLPKDVSDEEISASLKAIWMDAFTAVSDETTEHSLEKAVRILARAWRHGEALRQIYDDNKKEAGDSSDNSFYD